ncbi:hypothetical protein ABE142_14995 [Paenibacillus alvei]|uniref:hypothetical protein n=1 Tax=Paenibacillus alvei TaxID=44250 RepID=UPI003D270BA1
MFRWTSHNWKWIVSVLVVVAVVGWIIGDWKWFLGVLIPAFISVVGWIYVSRSDKRHIKEEKRITMKIEAYNNVKNPLLEVSTAYSKLNGFVLQIQYELSLLNSGDERIVSGAISRILLDLVPSLHIQLLEEATEKFSLFVKVWEQHELLLESLKSQRLALQKEHLVLIKNVQKLNRIYRI